MDYRLLGPLEVRENGRPVRVGAAKDDALLALLLLHRGEVVTSERLIDALWGEHPPPTAAKSVQVHVSHLRKVLGARRIVTRGRGYMLEVGPEEVDVGRFERASAEGRRLLGAGDAAGAADVLRDGLAMWRGPPLADFVYEPFAAVEIARLEELRLATVEDRVDADLALGRHAALVPELEALVREHPLRERLRGQLMLALYRCGRQADALDRFRHGRRGLVDELGLEPGRELRGLEQAILRQEPDLDGPRPAVAQQPTARRTVRVRWLVAAGAALVLVAVGAAALHGRSGRAAVPLLGTDHLGVVDAGTGRLVASVAVPGAPDRLAVLHGTVWAVGDTSGTVSPVGLRRRPVDAFAPGGTPSDVAAEPGAVWALDETRRVVTQIRPGYRAPVHRARLPVSPVPVLPRSAGGFDPWTIAAGADAAWVTDGSSRLTRVDAATGAVSRSDLRVPLSAVAVARDGIWVVSGPRATVLRIDPRRARPTMRVAIASRAGFASPYPIAVATGLGSVWVLNGNTATVTRIDPRIGEVVATIQIGIAHAPQSLAVGARAVWVAGGDGTLSRLDPAAERVASVTAIGHGLLDVAVAGSQVWVSATRGFAPDVSQPSPNAAARAAPSRGLGVSTCAAPEFGPGGHPRMLVAADLPLQGVPGIVGLQMAEAINYVLRRHEFRAGRYEIGAQTCDDGVADGPDFAKCHANAGMYARNRSVAAVIGPFASDCTVEELPTLNSAPGGPIAVISPSNTYVGLTRRGPGTKRSEPARYAPSGHRSYVRLMPPDDIQGAADAEIAQRFGLRRLFVLSDGLVYSEGVAAAFRRAAGRLGMDVVGTGSLGGGRRIVGRVRASRAQGVFLAGYLVASAKPLIEGLRRVIPSVRLLAPDAFTSPDVGALVGPAAEGMTVSIPGLPLNALRGEGARFVARFGAIIGARPNPFAVYAAQAVEVLLHAIARSDGTRPSIARAMMAVRVRNGLLGTFGFTPEGDITRRSISIYRERGGELRPWVVVAPPATLVGSG